MWIVDGHDEALAAGDASRDVCVATGRLLPAAASYTNVKGWTGFAGPQRRVAKTRID